MKIKVVAEFRHASEEMRSASVWVNGQRTDRREDQLKRVWRFEVDGESCICTPYRDDPIKLPDGIKKGDTVELELTGLASEKDATYIKIASIKRVGK